MGKRSTNDYKEIESLEQLLELGKQQTIFSHCAFQDIDFSQFEDVRLPYKFEDCIFLGCKFPSGYERFISVNCLIFPQINVPYNPFRSELYNGSSLYEGFDSSQPDSQEDCYDQKVYRHYMWTGKQATDIKETLARSLHDHSISDAMYDFLENYDEKKIVGIMGGHGLLRTDSMYAKIVGISKELTERGYLMVSGGGPGAMEATHLGAWLAGRSSAEVGQALDTLSIAPKYSDSGWLGSAMEVIEKYPQQKYKSLGVPTWLYGHEPATPFATHIAKYFENSIREDTILSIAKGGVIYTPGSAGTMQEVFQDAVQNHYLSFGYASPMVFIGVDYWTKEMPIYTMLQSLLESGRYKNLILNVTDDSNKVIEVIEMFV